jgi:hypothetical protein
VLDRTRWTVTRALRTTNITLRTAAVPMVTGKNMQSSQPAGVSGIANY